MIEKGSRRWEEIRQKVGCLDAIENSDSFEDNLAIALVSYFEARLGCPEDGEIGPMN